MIHGFVMLELAGYFGDDGSAVGPVLGAMVGNLLVALGDSPERLAGSLRAACRLAEQTRKAPGMSRGLFA